VNGRVYIPLISNPITITPSAHKNQSYYRFSQSYIKPFCKDHYTVTCSNFVKHQFSLHTVLSSYDDITVSQYMFSYEALTLWACHGSQPGTITMTLYWGGHTVRQRSSSN